MNTGSADPASPSSSAPSPALPAGPTGGGVVLLAYACFFASGASALVYEVVWMRQLQLTLGGTTAAVSVVLATFMLGMALGAWLMGGRADASANPLRIYAYLEAAIGLYALAFPALMESTRPLYVSVAQALEGATGLLVVVRFVWSAATLLVPTALMGATLPVLLRFVSANAALGPRLGSLYGTNVAGAVLGSVAAGFVLIRFLGVSGANMAAVVTNLVIALVALLASQSRGASASALGPGASALPPRPPAAGLLWVVVGLSGFVTLGCEILWARMLMFSYHNTVYAFTVILATFLAGLALGSWFFAVAIADRRESLSLLGGVHAAAALAALVLVPSAVRAFEVNEAMARGLGATATTQVLSMALSASALMLLPTVLMGIVFPMASRMVMPDTTRAGSGIGAAYLVNTLGGAAGALLVPFLFLPMLSLKGAFVGLCLVQGLVAAMLLWRGRSSGRAPLLAGLGAALGLGALLVVRGLPGPAPFDPLSRYHAGVELVAHRDASTASVSVVDYPDGGRALRIDGFEAAADDPRTYSYMRLMTHLPLLLQPEPEQLLVISFGTGATTGSGLLHRGVDIHAVDINRAVLEYAPLFEVANGGVLRSPRARAIVDDGRNYVLTTRDSYDVITSEPMPPTFAGIVNLYSREYYALARERLRPGGQLAQWLPFHLLDTPQSLAILKTVQSVFPQTSLWLQGRSGIIIGQREGRQVLDVKSLEERLAEPALAAGLRRLGIEDLGDLLAHYALGPAAVARLTRDVPLILDEHPSLEFHPPRNRFYLREGRYRQEEFDLLASIQSLALADSLPLTGATTEETRWLEERRRLGIHAYLSDMLWAQGRQDQARAALVVALGEASTDAGRAYVLQRQAALAAASGALERAREKIDESLRLAPGREEARDFDVRLRERERSGP